MKKILIGCVVLGIVAALFAYGNFSDSGEGTVAKGTADAAPSAKKPLVIYFTYSENMGNTDNMSVDAITSASLHEPTKNTKGNMQVMAEEIKLKTGADVYSIVVEDSYDPVFEKMRDRVLEEIEQNKNPKLKGNAPNLKDYDTIYFGSPVWHYTLPPAVRAFLTENDLSGKNLVPFGIHRGSGFSSNLETIKELQPGIRMTDGFTIDSRTPNDQVKKEFDEFLDKLLANNEKKIGAEDNE